MKKIKLKNGIEAVIREAVKEDAQQMIDFYNVVGGESDFLSFGKNEFKKKATEYESFLEAARQEDNSIILLALVENTIVSIATLTSSQRERSKHVGTLGIVISEKYTGMGLGRVMMDELIDFAKSNGITQKISLVTREDNTVAIDLYKKLGFKVEGIIEKETYMNGVYYDTIMMGLFV